jgi:crotonobetainyl-CoA:carnitine CoA-transferase CaiB-like acyl-CoA transferase
MVVEVDHYGEPIKLLGNPIKLSNHHERFLTPPRLGENTVGVLKEVLGYGGEEIEGLKKRKVINT